MTKPKIIAHRGSSATCHENTMAAFWQAVADRADGIEFDLRLSSDRQWVVHHNPDALVRGVPMRLSRLTLAEIVQLPIGTGKDRIPTLAELLEWAGSQPISLMFDIKDTDGVPELVSLLAERALPQRMMLSSFNRSVLQELHRLHPEWPRALIVNDPRWRLVQKLLSGWLVRSATDNELTALHLHQRWITPSLITSTKSVGIELAVWTVDDPARIAMLSWLGVDSIITNDPALARRTVDELSLSKSPQDKG